MKKHKFLLIALCLLTIPTFALDFGGYLTNKSALESYGDDNEFKLDQQNSVSLWLRQNFNKSGENYFAVQGSYNFEADLEEDDYINALDLELFKVSSSINSKNSKLTFDIGRFYFSDLSGIIFSQNADGVKIAFENSWIQTSLYASYTGLLNAITTEIITTPASSFLMNKEMLPLENSSIAFNEDDSKIYDLAQKYVFGAFNFALPNLFLNQSIYLEFLESYRLESDEKDFNRMYATLYLDGPIYSSLFYNASTTFGISTYDGETDVSNLSSVSVKYYLKNASFGASAIYASGNQGSLSTFSGFTKITSTYSLQNFLYSGIIKAGINANFKPISVLLLSCDCDAIFNAAAGNDFDEIEYYAFQYSFGALWQVKSDFKLGFTGCQFFDKENSDLANKTYFCVNASLAF